MIDVFDIDKMNLRSVNNFVHKNLRLGFFAEWNKTIFSQQAKSLLPLPASATSKSFSCSASRKSEKVYELRTYSLVPQRVGEFLQLSKEKFHLRTNHSVMLGYWTTELGGLNQVVHLWEYGSLSERAGVRAKLAGDQEWQKEYFQKILPMLQHQDNLTLTSLMAPVAVTEPSGAYELWQLNMSTTLDNWSEPLLQLVQGLQSEDRKLCGVFRSEFGPMNTAVVIWSHRDIDNSGKLVTDLFNDPAGKELWKSVTSSTSKLMSSTPFSPWK